jgi:putative membrane protein
MYGWSMGVDAWLWMGIWGFVLLLIVWLLVREPRRTGRDEALDVLRSRFARGELSAEEFESARHVLESPAAPTPRL